MWDVESKGLKYVFITNFCNNSCLSAQGRLVSDVVMYNISPSKDESPKLLLEVHAKHASEILKYLTLYKLRSAVKVEQGQYQVRINACHPCLQHTPYAPPYTITVTHI